MRLGVETLAVSTAEDRACLAVRMALRAFGDGVLAADWLITPHASLGGREPLFVAKESMAGCARVCQELDGFVSG